MGVKWCRCGWELSSVGVGWAGDSGYKFPISVMVLII
jgi:hypothetical protein